MSRSRATLHRTSLAEFRAFCETLGWVDEEPKGAYEALRMRHPEVREPLLVHTRHGGDHFTTWGQSEHLVGKWLRARRASYNKQHGDRGGG